MRRREFVGFAVAGVVLWPLAAPGQPAKRLKLGVLLVGNREPFSREFGEGLRELGYIDGQNITIELRSAEGKLDRLPELATPPLTCQRCVSPLLSMAARTGIEPVFQPREG